MGTDNAEELLDINGLEQNGNAQALGPLADLLAGVTREQQGWQSWLAAMRMLDDFETGPLLPERQVTKEQVKFFAFQRTAGRFG